MNTVRFDKTASQNGAGEAGQEDGADDAPRKRKESMPGAPAEPWGSRAEHTRMTEEVLGYREHIRSLGAMLAAVEEDDRQRLSSLLHDTVIQSLSLANIRLGAVRQMLEESGAQEPARKLDEARNLLAQGIRECRLVMSDLTPPLLYELGVVSALRGLAQKLSEKHGVTVAVEEDGNGSAAKPLRGLLYQATRELIINAIKHSGVTEINVTVCWGTGRVTVTVADAGRGFNVAGMDSKSNDFGFGLLSIRERIESVGGRSDIRSSPGKGTTVVLSIPLPSGKPC